MNKEKCITKFYFKVITIVFSKLIFIETVECLLKSHLYLMRQTSKFLNTFVLVTPLIADKQFHNLIGTEYNLFNGTAYKVITTMYLCKFHNKEQWYASEIHLCTSIYRELCNKLMVTLAD